MNKGVAQEREDALAKNTLDIAAKVLGATEDDVQEAAIARLLVARRIVKIENERATLQQAIAAATSADVVTELAAQVAKLEEEDGRIRVRNEKAWVKTAVRREAVDRVRERRWNRVTPTDPRGRDGLKAGEIAELDRLDRIGGLERHRSFDGSNSEEATMVADIAARAEGKREREEQHAPSPSGREARVRGMGEAEWSRRFEEFKRAVRAAACARLHAAGVPGIWWPLLEREKNVTDDAWPSPRDPRERLSTFAKRARTLRQRARRASDRGDSRTFIEATMDAYRADQGQPPLDRSRAPSLDFSTAMQLAEDARRFEGPSRPDVDAHGRKTRLLWALASPWRLDDRAPTASELGWAALYVGEWPDGIALENLSVSHVFEAMTHAMRGAHERVPGLRPLAQHLN